MNGSSVLEVQKFKDIDPIMAGVIERVGAFSMAPRRIAPFQALVHAIAHQQLSGSAAASILKRFIALFPNSEFPSPDQVLAIEFPLLRAVGLSGPKARYIADIAAKAAAGVILSLEEMDALTDAEIIDRLTTIKGVGRWTAEMLLIFNMGRPDVLPVHDLGIRKGFQIAYRKRKLPTSEQLDRFGRPWAPYRTTAARYLWRVADMEDDGKW